MVFRNLCKGLDKAGIPYEVNIPFHQLRPNDRVGVLGRGHYSLEGYDQSNPIVAGIGLMTHPSQWPDLCEEYPVVRYLQHSEWANDMYRPYFGDDVCEIWPVGIDTEEWCPDATVQKTVDVLIYDKIRWNRADLVPRFLDPIKQKLKALGVKTKTIRYGSYTPDEYRRALKRSHSMLFLSEHESQGLACQEALSSNVPVFAWDPGQCLDPNRFAWGSPHIPATSVPYWDERCGMKFSDLDDFERNVATFWEHVNGKQFSPREYIVDNLTLEGCARHYVSIIEEATTRDATDTKLAEEN
jgi:glycosyltransferase involved in cell wall biosynthesis